MSLFPIDHHHHHYAKGPYEQRINVHEHKAPTDKSIELLNEMQEKAKRNIIATIKIEENFLKAVVIYYQDEMVSDEMIFHIKFQLNGKEYIFKDSVNKFIWNQEISKTYGGLGNLSVFRALYKKFSEVIATELMKKSPDFLQSILPNNQLNFQ